jgi:hypothetical protein
LVKTFWGWRDRQLPDGAVILQSPSGHVYVTTPGSALLFPSLCRSTGNLSALNADPRRRVQHGDRTAMMPKRRRTRAQDRAARVAAERGHHQRVREREKHREKLRIIANDEPPPF